MDMGEWLRSIDLGQYEATFRDNEIDDKIVRSLTAEDLKDLGVTLVGHRRRILTAIAELSAPAAAISAAAGTDCQPPCHRIPPGRGRAPPTDGPVLRSGRINGNVGSALIPRTCARSFEPIKTPAPM